MNSLKTRLLLTTVIVLTLFIVIIEFVTTQVFEDTLLESVHGRLAADASALAVVAHSRQGRLIMPQKLGQISELLSQGLIYDSEKKLIWHTGKELDSSFSTLPNYDRNSTVPTVVNITGGTPYFIYGLDKTIGGEIANLISAS